MPYLQSSSGNGSGRAAESQKVSQGLDYGYAFIEKFVQLSFQVPRPSAEETIDDFFDKLFGNNQEAAATESEKQNLKRDIRNLFRIRKKPDPITSPVVIGPDRADNGDKGPQEDNENSSAQNIIEAVVDKELTLDKLREIGKMVALTLDYNPRRLKLFINLLKLKAYIAWNTGFKPEQNSEEHRDSQRLTLEQLGKFTVISLKWPLLLVDLSREEELLAYLQRFAINGAATKTEKVPDKTTEFLSPSVKKWRTEQKLIDLLRVGCLKGNPDPDRYSLETVNIRKLLEVSPPLVRSTDDLRSETGIDCRKLQQLLQEQNWKAADKETYEVMIRAVGKQPGAWFTEDELLNFPYTDLQTIDDLWMEYSNGRFGFSVQKKLYEACGGKLGNEYPGHAAYNEFAEVVGWRRERRGGKKDWIDDSEVTFRISARHGHLPLLQNLRESYAFWYLFCSLDQDLRWSRIRARSLGEALEKGDYNIANVRYDSLEPEEGRGDEDEEE